MSNLLKNDELPEGDFIPHTPVAYTLEEMVSRSEAFYQLLQQRRSVRHFAKTPVPIEILRSCIAAACTAPSGANKQPWTFCVIADPVLKAEIRRKAEEEEYRSYNGRMSDQWIADLKPLGTDPFKPFLEDAPYLIAVFKKVFDEVNGKKVPNYYVSESVGIATGMLLAALHNAGLSTLTHTPSPMNFLAEILNRPETEKAYLLIPLGYADPDAKVPNIGRKPLSAVSAEYL